MMPFLQVYYNRLYMLDHQKRQLFRRSSRTYYISSIFFPEPVRSDVFTLYAYVRTADNCVDALTPDRQQFDKFVTETWRCWQTGKGDDSIVTDFVKLCKHVSIEAAWVEAFLASMALDFDKKRYRTLSVANHYMYGSAEVIGLMLARIFKLPVESYPTARLLGRSMQFINMIRDVAEDSRQFGRQYLPMEEMRVYGLKADQLLIDQLSPENQGYAAEYLRAQLGRQQRWMIAAQSGFHFLPRSLRIPVQTSTDMYCWTAAQIWQNPLVVFKRQVKPSGLRVAATAVSRTIRTGFDQ